MGTMNRIWLSKGFPVTLIAVAAVLSALFLLHPAGAAHAGTITTCAGCHGMPPVDAAYRNISTGRFVGNHSTHSSVINDAPNCGKCHRMPSTNYHRSGSINFVPNLNNSPVQARYRNMTSVPQTATPVFGTCANVNCHFEATTPQWGSATFSAPADCNKCHGAPPSGGATGAAGSHAKHDLYYSGAANCQKCHSNNTTFSHATSAGHRNLNISFAAAPNNGSGAYSGVLNDYLPSQANAFGSCTATYCHSPGNKASSFDAPNLAATWGTPLPANCTGCHKSNSASGNPMASGSHGRHVNGIKHFPVGCDKCHASTASNAMTITDTSSHVNAKVNIAFNSISTASGGTYVGQATPYAKDPGAVYGQCNNVYCHSNVQNEGGTGITYRQPTWGNSASGMCGSCHGTNHHGGAEIATGSHTKHLNSTVYTGTMRCVICHNVGGLAFDGGCNNSCHTATSKHVNYKVDLVFPSNFGASAVYNGTPAPGDGYNTCSNISCHYSTTTPAWGTATPITCVGCHSLAVLLASGAHAKHISATAVPTLYNYTANRSTAAEYNFGCSNCHPLTSTNHYNSVISVTLKNNEAGVGSLRARNSATAVGINVANSGIIGTSKSNVRCTMAYCHSNGDAANPVYATTPNWYGGSFTGDRCANCHGNAPNSTIAGSRSHYNNRFLGYTSTPGGHQIGIHAMSIYSSASGLAKAGTTGKSSHGNPATATTISCNICHYGTVTTARNDENPVCKTCHYAGNTVGAQVGNPAAIADKSKHVNGLVNVEFKPVSMLSKAQVRQKYYVTHAYSSVWTRNGGYKTSGAYDSAKAAFNTATMWDGSTKTCSNIACHNGNSVKWGDNDGVTECFSCHGSL